MYPLCTSYPLCTPITGSYVEAAAAIAANAYKEEAQRRVQALERRLAEAEKRAADAEARAVAAEASVSKKFSSPSPSSSSPPRALNEFQPLYDSNVMIMSSTVQ